MVCCIGFCRRNVGLNRVTFSASQFLFSMVMFITSVILTSKNYNRAAQQNWSWVGGVQSTSASFRVRIPDDDDGGGARRFVVSTSDDLNDESARKFVVDAGSDVVDDSVRVDQGVMSVTVTDLESDSKYYFGTLEENGEVAWNVGSFRTPSPEGTRMNFKVATGGCALTGSKNEVFDNIASLEPFLFIHAGDLHYEDIDSTDIAERINAFDLVMGSPSQGRLFSSVAMSYMWDDHDWVGNNEDSSDEAAGEAARKSYQIVFPHYPLAADTDSGTGPVNVATYQAFTTGTVRFVVSDLRSESLDSTDSSQGTIYSEEQKEWLFSELENADSYDFIVWVTSRPWTGPAKRGSDGWAGFDTDRKELSEKIASTVGQGKQNLLVVSSDNHQVAYDDGSSTDFSGQKDNPAGFPIIHSGPLANFGSGVVDFFAPNEEFFTDGCHVINSEVNHQFSVIEFIMPEDDDGEPCLEIKSYRDDEGSLIFTKKLCGSIMKVGTEESSTCRNQKFSSTTTALISTGLGFLFVFIVASYCFLLCMEATILSAISLVFFLVTILAAVAGAFCFGSLAVNTFVVSIMIMLQIIFACIFLYFLVKKRRAERDSGASDDLGADKKAPASDSEEENGTSGLVVYSA